MSRADKDLQGMVGLRHETRKKKGRTDMIVPWIESSMEKYLIVNVHSLPSSSSNPTEDTQQGPIQCFIAFFSVSFSTNGMTVVL